MNIPWDLALHIVWNISWNIMGSSQSTTHDIPRRTYEDILARRATNAHRAQQRTNAPTSTATQCTIQHTIAETPPTRPVHLHRQNSIIRTSKEPDINKDSTICFQPNVMPQNEYQIERRELYNSTKETGSLVRNEQLLNNYEDTIGTKLNKIIKPPNRFNDLDDFIQNWSIWQEQLTSFLTLNNSNKSKYHEWGCFFLHFMGPVGQKILSNLFFNKQDDKKDYVILIRKYNLFHEFYITAKLENESIMDYIKRLKSEAALNIINVDETLKEKLAKDIQKHHRERFTALASSKLLDFKFETTFKSLTLAEIAFLWQLCEESTFQSNKNCAFCGQSHRKGRCRAFGKECNKCKRTNHFANCCPELTYINNCSFCGGNHAYKKCPAYGETCSKCGNMNHFSWKCSKEILLKNCHFCGLSHLQDRNKCPARNSLCCICKTHGHYEVKCYKKQNATK